MIIIHRYPLSTFIFEQEIEGVGFELYSTFVNLNYMTIT